MSSATLELGSRGRVAVHGRFSSSNLRTNLLRPAKRADISIRMWLRRLILKMMWLSPVIMLAGIGVHARTYVDPYTPQGTDPVQQSRILGFKEIVSESDAAIKGKASGAEILILMDRWHRMVGDSNEGRLVPVGADDTCTEGAKAEIFHASAGLSSYLIEMGQKEASQNPGRALDYYRAALQNAELLKYMDMISVRSAVMNERRAVRLMENLDLDAKGKAQVATYLASFLKQQRGLEDLDQMAETAFNRTRDRAAMDLVSLRGERLEVKRGNEARRFGGQGTPELVSALRMTHYTQSTFESLLRNTISKLEG